MAITLDGTSGVTAPLFDGPLDAADLTGDVAAARITGALNATGSAPIYACRAWVNFNGTGTPAIRASGNISSLEDNGVGRYTVNFTTAMPDANYCVVTQGTSSGKGYTVNAPENASSGNIGTTGFATINCDFNGNTNDFEYMFFAIFR
jgi:hypothetical protein